MIRYRQIPDDPKVVTSEGDKMAEIRQQKTKVVTRAAEKRRHYQRKDEPPPRKVAGRHAAPRPKDA